METFGLPKFIEPTEEQRQQKLEESLKIIAEDPKLQSMQEVFKDAQALPDKLMQMAGLNDWIISADKDDFVLKVSHISNYK